MDFNVTLDRAGPGDVLECAVDQEGLDIGRQRIREFERLDANPCGRQQHVAREVDGRLAAGIHHIGVVERESVGLEARLLRVECPGEIELGAVGREVQENGIAVGLAGDERDSSTGRQTTRHRPQSRRS